MFVTNIEKKPRPTKGIRAFTDAEEAEIHQLVTVQGIRPELVAAELGVSFNTIRNVLSRQEKSPDLHQGSVSATPERAETHANQQCSTAPSSTTDPKEV